MSEPQLSSPPSTEPFEPTVVIVGVGLIGGSLAAALRQRFVARKIIGVGRDVTRIEAARDAGLIDEATTDIRTVVNQADLLVFCTPVDRVPVDVLHAVSGIPRADIPLMTDVGSVKGPICRELADVSRFIGSHPIAGSHRQGFEAADANLFEGRTCVITPIDSSDEQSTQRLERFWSAVGMTTFRMSPEAHDDSLAMTSHLPHVVAAALAATLSEENRRLTGSGFRDTTRVAEGDPTLWTGILMQNAEFVVQGIDRVIQQLSAYRTALKTHEPVTIQNLLLEGQRCRTALDRMQRRID